eukprot:1161835-Pelagomonas_calceolata.AAC.11
MASNSDIGLLGMQQANPSGSYAAGCEQEQYPEGFRPCSSCSSNSIKINGRYSKDTAGSLVASTTQQTC